MELLEQNEGKELPRPFSLILAPTRELALQITKNLKIAATSLPIKIVPVVGGMAPQKQERLLKKNPEIIVGTPGRLWNLLHEGVSSFKKSKQNSYRLTYHAIFIEISFRLSFDSFLSY